MKGITHASRSVGSGLANRAAVFVLVVSCVGCGSSGDEGETASTAEAGVDVAIDIPLHDVSLDLAKDTGGDASPDANGAEVSSDAPADASTDTASASDAGDGSAEASADALADGGDEADAGADGGDEADAGADGGDEADAGADALDAAPVPHAIGSGFNHVLAIVADDTDVYFSYTSDIGGANSTVVRCPIATGCPASPEVLDTGLDNPIYLALDATNLYIGAAGTSAPNAYVYQCPRAGCGASDADRIALVSAVSGLGGVNVVGSWVYFTDSPITHACGRAPVGGGDIEWLGDATGYVSKSPTTDGVNVYWAHQYYPPAIHVAPLTGAGASVLVDLVAANGGTDPSALTEDEGWLYYAATNDNELMRVKTDGTGLVQLAGGLSAPSYLVIDATDVYVGDYNYPSVIRRLPKAGGTATTFASSPQGELTSLAQNSTMIFWGNYAGEVWGQAK